MRSRKRAALYGICNRKLNNLAVLPEYRHKGIGKQLLNHAFRTARDMNCKVLNIGIVEENKIPVKFIGVGEQIDDMEIFNSEDFVKAII